MVLTQIFQQTFQRWCHVYGLVYALWRTDWWNTTTYVISTSERVLTTVLLPLAQFFLGRSVLEVICFWFKFVLIFCVSEPSYHGFRPLPTKTFISIEGLKMFSKAFTLLFFASSQRQLFFLIESGKRGQVLNKTLQFIDIDNLFTDKMWETMPLL